MGRVRTPIPRSQVPLPRRLLLDPVVLRSWLLLAAGTVVVVAAVAHLVTGAEDTRRAWGRTRPVLVASRAVPLGAPLAGAVSTRRWPEALVPRGALRSLPDGATAAGTLTAGVPVTEAALDHDAAKTGGPDRRLVALPTGDARLPLARGDRVDVWATFDPSLAGDRPTTRRVAIEAVVTSSSSRALVVGIRPAEVPDVAEATTTATITLVAAG